MNDWGSLRKWGLRKAHASSSFDGDLGEGWADTEVVLLADGNKPRSWLRTEESIVCGVDWLGDCGKPIFLTAWG